MSMARIAFILVAVFAAAQSQAAERLPNVVLILADDMGYGDLGCYGHPYARTPAIDHLAREGTAMRNFHVTGVTCCPSRTGFMTSKFPATYREYPASHGFGNRVTVTELLKKAGYTTGHFGKWHIGPTEKPGTYGIDSMSDPERAAGRRVDPRGRDAGIYDDAIKFVEANKDRPFYMNVWDHIPHFPVNPPDEYVAKFKDLKVKESDFAPTMREKFELVKKAGGDVTDRMRNYLADLLSLDDCVGRLMKTIDELGLRDSTIVVFSSDQGAAPLRPPGEAKAKKATAERADLRLNMMGYCGVFRGGKHNMYEGGVRVPFLIRWPGHVPAGRVDEKALTCGIDWLPTLCSIAGVKIDARDYDGEDVSAVWLGKSQQRSKPLFWKVNNVNSEIAMLDGNWKLLLAGNRRGKIQDGVELYDLAADPGETTNLATKKPDIAKRLTERLQAWNATLPKEYLHVNDKEE
jgi:arylsulfatase A-like enzyme